MAATPWRSTGRMKNIYGMTPGEVYWAASDVGWVVGHSYIVYAPLLYGCTTVLYEGKPVGTPDAGAFWRVIAQHKVRALFTAPTAFRAIKREDPEGKLIKNYDLSHFRTLFLAGERSDPPTLEWAEQHLKVPVIDHWWQTETGWAICANCMGIEALPVKPGSPTKPAPGWDVRVLADGCREAKRGDIGALVCKLPLPPGSLATLWNADERYVQSYLTAYPGYYQTGDAGYVDDGRLRLRHGAHRRRHQRRRPPALDRRHGGGAGRPSRRGGMRGHRRRRRAEGPGAARASSC